jgi:hypothetical protein
VDTAAAHRNYPAPCSPTRARAMRKLRKLYCIFGCGTKVLAGWTWLCCTEAIFEATNNAYRGVCTQGLGQTLPGAAMEVQTLQTRRQGFSRRE